MSRPDCRGCVFAIELPDSGSHIECLHPSRHREVNHLMAAIAGGEAATNAPRPLNIQGDEHALKKGWFAWPLNFDPIWIRACDGYTSTVEKVVDQYIKDGGKFDVE